MLLNILAVGLCAGRNTRNFRGDFIINFLFNTNQSNLNQSEIQNEKSMNLLATIW